MIGVPEVMLSAPYESSNDDIDTLFETMQKYFKEHIPIEAYIPTGTNKAVSYVMGFVDKEPMRTINGNFEFVVIRGLYYPACNVRPKMTTFREDKGKGEYFIERNKHPGMTHQEMLDTSKKALKESEKELKRLKNLEFVSHHSYEETKQHERLIKIWKNNIKWNEDAIAKGNY